MDKWTFIQIFDLSKLLQEYEDLYVSAEKLRSSFEKYNNSAGFKIEYYNSYHIIGNLEDKIKLQFEQINPLIIKNNKHRIRRGIIDGLGSIIKTITGNLDAEDAEKYDKAIEVLSSNQNKIKTLLKDQITILQSSIEKFNKTTASLVHNQDILKNRILLIEKQIQENDIHNTDQFYHFMIQTVISQIITEYQMIVQILDNLENAITFSKLNILHNSIVEPADLFREIQLIQKHLLNNNKLPFEPNIDNLLLFEKITTVKSYAKGNTIIFIVEIPLTEKANYNYHQLYPLPIKEKTYGAILPLSKFLILNEKTYISTNTPCKEITETEYLCEDHNPTEVNSQSPCEVQLLRYEKNLTNCRRFPIELREHKIQKLSKNTYLLAIPDQLIASQICGKEKDNIPLQGPYVLELVPQCQVKIGRSTLNVYKESKINFRNIELPNIETELIKEQDTNFKIKPIMLDNIQLDDLKIIGTALKMQTRKIEEIAPLTYYNSISLWTILIYVIVVIALCYLVYKKCCKNVKFAPCKKSQSSNEEPRPESSHPLQGMFIT